MMNIPILRLPYTNEEIAEIQEGVACVLRSGVLTKGSTVEAFEHEWAAYCGVQHALACASGTSALEMIMRAIDVQDKEVIIPSNTFIATAVAVIRAGGKVVLADCERENLQLSLKSVMDCWTRNTVAVMLVHIGGNITPDIEQFKYWCAVKKVALVEDSCHAHGLEYDGHKAGSFGLAAGFSFFPTKILTTAEGGMITTDNPYLYEYCYNLRNQGRLKTNPQVHDKLGYNWRMDELRAVLGLQQVRKADSILAERRTIASWYDKRLPASVWCGEISPLVRPAYYKYVVLPSSLKPSDQYHPIAWRAKVNAHMLSKGIQMPGLVYEVPLHRQPVANMFSTPVPLDATDWVADHHLCLPLHLSLTEEEVDYVVESLREVL